MFTKKKFLSLKESQRHARAADACCELISGYSVGDVTLYNQMAEWMGIAPIEPKPAQIQDRFHFHRDLSGKGKALPFVYCEDNANAAPFLPIAIYLDRLRSSHNIGSIIRTTEALRCGHIHTPRMPTGIEKAAMGCEAYTPIIETPSIDDLPRPLVLLEKAAGATPLEEFAFPKPPFTLAVGNEELGCSPELLSKANAIVSIRLWGRKNSLNVAVAYALAAQAIRLQYLATGW